MSWWVSIEDEEERCMEVPLFCEGGTYAIGGDTVASLNVTYNYGVHYWRVLGTKEGLKSLDGLRPEEALEYLERGVEALGDEVDGDYWKASEGNAKRPLVILAEWCRLALKTERLDLRMRVI